MSGHGPDDTVTESELEERLQRVAPAVDAAPEEAFSEISFGNGSVKLCPLPGPKTHLKAALRRRETKAQSKTQEMALRPKSKVASTSTPHAMTIIRPQNDISTLFQHA